MSVSDLSPADLGRDFGREIFEQTRRRFASQFQTRRNQQRSQFAARPGGAGSSASAAASRELEREEFRQLADASLGAQLEGKRFGQEEAGRIEGIRQFDVGQEFNQEQLRVQEMLARLGIKSQADLQKLRGSQAMAQLQAQFGFQNQQNRFGSLGQIGSGLGSLIQFLPFPGAGAAGGALNLLGNQ